VPALRHRHRFGALLAVATAAALTGPIVAAPAAHATADGYRLLGMDGGVFAFGAPFLGAPASDPTRCPPNPPNRSLPTARAR